MEKSISDQIKETYLDYISKYHTGLVLAPLPTAIGKTYSACQAIADIVAEMSSNPENCDRQIVFTTSLRKNLPEKELRAAFSQRNLDYDGCVVSVKSNKDCIKEAYENGYFDEMPEDQRQSITDTANFDQMVESLKMVIQAEKSSNPADRKLSELKYMPDFSKSENNFRQAIHNLLARTAKSKNTTVEHLVYDDQSFGWLRKTYPQILDKKYKVFLMSVQKLLQGKCRILRKYGYFSEEWLKNKVIFIDEIDYTKTDFNSYILKEAKKFDDINETIDVLQLFNTIRHGLADEEAFSKLPRDAWASLEKMRNNKTRLQQEADNIVRRYHVQRTFKFVGENEDSAPYFLYRCSTWLTASPSGNDHYIWAKENKKQNRMELYKGNREEWASAKDYIVVNKMLTDIDSFIGHFVRFVSWWAMAYEKLVNDSRDDDDSEFIYSYAITSLLHNFNFKPQELQLLADVYHITRRPVRDVSYVKTPCFFRNGAEWFSFLSNEAWHEHTIIRMVKISDTAENLLLYLCRHSLCIGLSATALCPTSIGNYSLRFLRDELSYTDNEGVRHNDFHDMLAETPELARSIQESLDEKYRKYHLPDGDSQRIFIDPIVRLDNQYDADTCRDGILKHFFPETEEGQGTASLIEGVIKKAILNYNLSGNGNDYLLSRYCNIARIIFIFASHREHQSCLCLGMKMPEDGGSSLDLRCLREIIKRVNLYYKYTVNDWTERDDIKEPFVIDSSNFEDRKKDFERHLGDGDRLFVISTYATLAAGQNLQHPICEWIRKSGILVRLDGSDGRDTSMKDIDELALLDYTNVVVNLADSGRRLSLSGQMENIIQTEECYTDDELSASERYEQIRNGLKKMTSSKAKFKNVIRDTSQANLQITHWVIQADGRTKRSPWRTRHQQLYIDTKVLGSIDTDYMETILPYCSPELKALYEERRRDMVTVDKPNAKYLEEGERKSIESRLQINRMIASIDLPSRTILWSDQYMKAWNDWREKALKHPSGVGKEERLDDDFFKYYYIPTPPDKPSSSFFYHSLGDFSPIFLSFGPRQSFEQKMKDRLGKYYSPSNTHEVSMESSRLEMLLRYRGLHENLKDFLIRKGYATEWQKGDYMMSPVIYQQIYLGALGEVAGKFIMEDRIEGCSILPIIDNDKFEAFDGIISGLDSVYVDFKFYRGLGEVDNRTSEEYTRRERDHVHTKMEIINAKSVFIIGIIERPDRNDMPRREGNVYYIPHLMSESGDVDYNMIEAIKEYLKQIKDSQHAQTNI